MPVKVTLPNGKNIWLPSSWSNEQIYRYADRLLAREKETDIGAAFMRGLGKHAPDIIDLGAGAVGIAHDLFGGDTLAETEKSIRDFSDTVRYNIAGESLHDYSDTFLEHAAEAVGSLPGVVTSFLPFAALPGSGVAGAAARFS